MIKSLQSLRFIFILMVFHHHFFSNPQIVPFGTFPVCFFFILSGYVMSIGYADKVISPSFQYKPYIKRRLIRILPLNIFSLFLYLTIPIFYDISRHQLNLSSYLYFIPDIFLIQAWVPLKSVYFSGNAVAWFLSAMLFCYLVFPYLLKFLSEKKGKILFFITIIAYFFIIQFIEDEKIHALVYISPFFRVLDFMIGIMLYFSIKGHVTSQSRPIASTILELFSILTAICSLIAFYYVPKKYGFASLYWLPSILLIVVFTLSSKWGGYVSRLISSKFLVFLGVLSFPFYMLHFVLIGWCKIILNRFHVSIETLPVAILCILLTLALSLFYVKVLEPKIINRLQKI